MVTNNTRLGRGKGLTVPDLDKSIVNRGASGGIHDSEVHDECYSPIPAVIRMKRQSIRMGAYP